MVSSRYILIIVNWYLLRRNGALNFFQHFTFNGVDVVLNVYVRVTNEHSRHSGLANIASDVLSFNETDFFFFFWNSLLTSP